MLLKNFSWILSIEMNKFLFIISNVLCWLVAFRANETDNATRSCTDIWSVYNLDKYISEGDTLRIMSNRRIRIFSNRCLMLTYKIKSKIYSFFRWSVSMIPSNPLKFWRIQNWVPFWWRKKGDIIFQTTECPHGTLMEHLVPVLWRKV